MFGLSFDKLILLGVILVVIIGPERLPQYAAKFARLVRTVRAMADSAKERIRGEMGPEFDDIDWVKLDPRQYDPRRIVRDALLEDPAPRVSVRRPGDGQPGDERLADGRLADERPGDERFGDERPGDGRFAGGPNPDERVSAPTRQPGEGTGQPS